jgi:hypothetical protein
MKDPVTMSDVWYALSVRQPWAALLVAGVKSIEVRTWPAAHRGRILIHAGRVPDPRPQAWEWVTTPALTAAAALTGGVVGVGDLVDCLAYPTRARFAADRDRHLNEPDWFVKRGLYGFVFRDPSPLPFHPCRGQTFFFRVRGLPVPPHRPRPR